MSCLWSPAIVLLSALALIIIVSPHGAEGKRGCATFGHSCYGGMGKRASDLLSNEDLLQDIQADGNPEVIFTEPKNVYKSAEPERLTQQQYDNMSRLIRQWILSYRRAQEHEDNTI